MSFLRNIFKNLMIKEPEKKLGRWNIVYSTKIIDRNIDLSNEDHCGSCNVYITRKNNKNIQNEINR
jgi:hypothetical protein